MINYSIIIPHKDIPDLLIRCLNSIPERDDVQIIVVDDNSKDAETYKEKYPELSRPNLDLYLTKEGKGAGYARNVGLDHAKGKWLIFADADDFFSPQLLFLLDKYKEAEEDIIYFDFRAVMSNEITKVSGRDTHAKIGNFIDEKSNTIDDVRYMHIVPWAKMIRRELVEKNNIRFQEIRWSNDVYFSTHTGVKAKKVRVVKEISYIVTERQESLSNNKDKSLLELRVRTQAGIDSYNLARINGYQGNAGAICYWTSQIYKSKYYIEFIRAIRGLDNYVLKCIYDDAIWGTSKLEKLFIMLLIGQSKICL